MSIEILIYLFANYKIGAMITLVAAYADELDDRLVDEFGGRLYVQI
ncbi:MAG: hypothetical protein SGI73_13925 [Chloroflexota bacterium]|nr:hypothetical protein [Chloroflexota bacterium]